MTLKKVFFSICSPYFSMNYHKMYMSLFSIDFHISRYKNISLPPLTLEIFRAKVLKNLLRKKYLLTWNDFFSKIKVEILLFLLLAETLYKNKIKNLVFEKKSFFYTYFLSLFSLMIFWKTYLLGKIILN
jgi:hypothetical protein